MINHFKPPKYILLVCGTFIITACGGGGGSGNEGSTNNQRTLPPEISPEEGTDSASDFDKGIFSPYRNFEQICVSPRSGIDSNGNPFADSQGDAEDEKNWLRAWSNSLYFWYDEIVDLDPRNLTTQEYFNQMQTFELTESGAQKDKFHFIIPTEVWLEQSRGVLSSGYGATFVVLDAAPPRQIVVAYTEPNTPATLADVGLSRGATILEVDGTDLVNGNDVDTLNKGLFPGPDETHTFVIRDLGEDNSRTITMTSTQINTTPVQNVSTIETNAGRVGYITFNDHISSAESQLIDAMALLSASNISDLILDIRYNGGGFLDIANELAYMIAGDTAAGQIFETLVFNEQHPNFDPVTGRPLTPTRFHTTAQGFSTPSGTPLPKLGLTRVFVLTGPGTCSASESIINSLKGINVEVIQIGETSCGKPYGFYPFDNCGTTYFSIQFRGENQKGFGGYSDGFTPSNSLSTTAEPLPGCLVSDDFTRQLGDPLEGRLRAALQYRRDGTCPVILSNGQKKSDRATRSLNATDGNIPKAKWLQNRILKF